MKLMKKVGLTIALVEVGVAAAWLVVAIVNILSLPSVKDSGVGDLFDVREDHYPLVLFWTTLLVAGLMYWKNKKWHWVLTQVILIPTFIMYGLFPLAVEGSSWLTILYFVLYITAIILAERFLFRKSYLEANGVSPALKMLTVFSGIIFFFIFTIGWVAIYDTLIA